MSTKIILCLLISQFLVFGTIDRIQKAMEKSEFDKVEELILKGYEKEPKNPGIPFYHAKLLFTSTYNGFNADSARVIMRLANDLYSNATTELKNELKDEGVEEVHFTLLTENIRDYLFQSVLKSLSIASIQDYRNNYPSSVYDDILIYKRDSISYRNARAENTEESYTTFIHKYPTSVFIPKADSIRDYLRFSKLKDTGTLKDYYAFLNRYPLTRWGYEVEKYILNISTANHRPDHYEKFIHLSSSERLKKKAADVLFYLSPEDAISLHPLKDSLEYIMNLDGVTVFPVMDRNKFGLYSSEGLLMTPYQYEDVQSALKCNASTDGWIHVQDEDDNGSIITKTGTELLPAIDDYIDLSYGLGMATEDGRWFLYHKSGFKVLNLPIQSAEVLDQKWIKVQSENGKWGLFTFLGVSIADFKYDDIFKSGPFWVFEKNGLLGVYTTDLILKEIEERGLSLEFKFEDIELVQDSMLIGFRGDRECLLNKKLDFMVPWGTYEIHPEPAGWYIRSNQGYMLYNNRDERVIDRNYEYLETNDGWLTLKMEQDWMLIPRSGSLQPSRGYDSIKLINKNAALLLQENKRILLFKNGKELTLDEHRIKSFASHPDYLSITNAGALGVYNANGELVIDGEYEEVSFMNDTLLRVKSRNKQGLVHVNGDWVLNPVFESLDEQNGLVLTLNKGKIGCYDLPNKTFIATNYSSRLSRISNHYLAKKEGKMGIIDAAEQEVIQFAYEEILPWNDSSYLVKNNGFYAIIDKKEDVIMSMLENLKLLHSAGDHFIYKFVRNGRFGMMSNQNGVLLDPEFTDILPIGTKDEPLFFADQNLAKAGFHVVSYVNEKGALVFSKAYRKEEFDRVLCDD